MKPGRGYFFGWIMIKINKGLFFKIVAACVSICVFVNTAAYCMPVLRLNSIFDKINEKKDEERAMSAVTKVVASENDFKERIRTIFEFLRPDFSEKKELSAKEFEKHIRLKAEKLGISYKNTKGNLFNFLYYNLKLIIQEVRTSNFKMAMDTLIYTCIMSVAPHAGRYPYSNRGSNAKETRIKIVVPGTSTSLIQALFAASLAIFVLPHFYLEILPLLLYLGVSSIINIIIDITSSDRILLHELKHAYVHLLKHMLVEDGVIKESVRIQAVDGDNKSLAERIDEEDIERLEEQALAALGDTFNIPVHVSYKLQAKVVSTESVISRPDDSEKRRSLIKKTIYYVDRNRNQL